MPGALDPIRAIGISLAAGVCGAIQPDVNAALGDHLGSSLLAALVNFLVALAVAVLVVSRRPGTRHHLAGVAQWPAPWWTRAAGLGGVIVVIAGVVTVERLGVAVFSIAFFAGQMTFGLAVDRLGIAPGGRRPITRARVTSVVLAMAAVGLAQVGRPLGELAPALVVLVVAAGAASAVQSACNGRITSAIGDPVAATALNVAVGAVCLGSIAGALALAGDIDPPTWPTQPWLYAGGVLGVTIVLALAAATSAIGVLRTTLAMLAAQLISAFLVDWMARGEAPTGGAVAAGSLIVVAVALVNRGSSRSRSAAPVTRTDAA